ncbi:F-box DNA helicase [Seminavis robusta]|uniref:DNA 3'-5' helicase n=1 Tax=Seminavis robusta TaxID=568900 RepID=A0A9N8DCJ2_9STRA|nr:F-box DNA helicase [Seminavis robusta]|eukprot:Sro77_g042050.1 F-box DNA helicase (767) ;mRNA; f:60211-62511
MSDFRRASTDAIADEERPSTRRRLTYEGSAEVGIGPPQNRAPGEEASNENGAALVFQDPKEDHQEESNEEATQPTPQQQEILAHTPQFGGNPVCVNALAGCGKTTTIALLCQNLETKYPGSNKLYLVFSKKNETEAMQSGKFPKTNMEIRTTHAFVLRHYFGTNMMCFQPQEDCTLDDIKAVVKLQEEMKMFLPNADPNSRKFKRQVNSVASYVRETVHKFQASDHALLDDQHIFWRAKHNTNMSKRFQWRNKIPVSKYKEWAAQFFAVVTERCHSVRDLGTPIQGISHDGYMKVCQLECDVTSGFQFVLVDEAQDLTPCQADLFWGDPGVRQGRAIYLFGDRYQQLDRFRGASDSFHQMWQLTAHKYNLTGSFRFGSNIAKLASLVLKVVGGEELVGRALHAGQVHNDEGFGNRGVVLCRTNQGLYRYLFFNEPTRWCFLDGSRRPVPDPPKWTFDLESFLAVAPKYGYQDDDHTFWYKDEEYRCFLAVAPEYSYQNDDHRFRYKDEVFSSIEEIKSFLDDEGDSDLNKSFHLLLFLKRQGKSLRDFISSIQRSFCPLEGDPDEFPGVVLSTVHKAKGLEFSRVLVFDDFDFGRIINSTTSKVCQDDEANILCVAVTRAKEHLFLCEPAQTCLEKLSQKFRAHNVALPSYRCIRIEADSAWNTFKSSRRKINSLEDIEWPSPDDSNILALDQEMSVLAQRAYLRALRLRYHPDEFFPAFERRIARSAELKKQIMDKLRDLLDEIKKAYRALQPEAPGPFRLREQH